MKTGVSANKAGWSPRGRSVRFQAGMVMLVPFLLVTLAIGFSQYQRLSEFREASRVSDATEQASGLLTVESQVRNEWLNALDIATIETTDFRDLSAEIVERASALGTETRQAFEDSAADTDRLTGQLDREEIPTAALERIDRLGDMRARVLARDITSAELDLFYSRLSDALVAGVPIDALPRGQAPESTLQFGVVQQRALSDAIADTGTLQRSMTRSIEGLVAVRTVEWSELVSAAAAAHGSVQNADRIGGGSRVEDIEGLLTLIHEIEQFSVEQRIAPSTQADSLEDVLELRGQLIAEVPSLVAAHEEMTAAIAESGEQARSEALQSLVSSLLVVLASAVLLVLAVGYLSRVIAFPLRRAANTAARVSQGDLDVELDVSEGPREVRLVSSALSELVGTVSLIERQAVAMAEGDLESPVLDEHLPGQLGRSLESSIGRWRDTSQQVQVSNMITSAVQDATSDAQLLCDADLLVIEANPAAELLFDMSAEQLIGKSLSTIATVPVIDAIDELGDNGTVTDEATIAGRAGEIRTLATITRVTTTSGPVHSVLLRDVSDRQQILDRLSFEVQHDRLTGLRSRQPFVDTLRRSLERESTGVLIVDIDNFSDVNARLDEWAGDQVLHVLADRLSNGIEVQQLARFGGDEFAISLSTDDLSEMQQLAEKIHELAARPVRIADQQISLTLSIGVAVAQSEAPDSVIGNAMIATRRAKRAGGNCTILFDKQLEADVENWRRVESDLREAIEEDELKLYLQPVVAMASGRIVGSEALVRWPKPDGSLISPADFIPLAEESGLIVELDRWVIDHTCQVLRDWPVDAHIAVNVSARHLTDGDLVATIRDATQRWGVDPERLGIEVTESVLLEDRTNCRKVLAEISELGVPLLIDDFGTGYSNLAYLQDFPFDILKIDKSFISRADIDEQSESLVAALVGLGRTMGMLVHAEGVETEAQRELLCKLGCDFEQGFLFSEPVPIEDFISLYEQHNPPMGQRADVGGSIEFPLAS